MPLIKSSSKKALKKNMEEEMEAHPSPEDRKQDMAIAYNVQRQAMKKPQKMAEGGMPKSPESMDDSDVHYDNIADAIMRKKKMADGGMVSTTQNAEEDGQTPYAEMNGEAYDDKLYDIDMLGDEPKDSMGDEEEKDEENDHDSDIVDRIRKKARK